MAKSIKELERELMTAHARIECNPTSEEYKLTWDEIERLNAEIAHMKAVLALVH